MRSTHHVLRSVSLRTLFALPLLTLAAFGQSANDGFDPDVNGPVHAIAVQPDGKILIGGRFTAVGGVPRSHLARLNPDGSLDLSFTNGVNLVPAPDFLLFIPVKALALQADGKILVGGEFNRIGGYARTNLARLHPDGSVDAAFSVEAGRVVGEGIFSVFTLVVQPDRKILVGGSFPSLGGQNRRHLGRLNPDGTVDAAFNASMDSWVESVAVQRDGRIVIGGNFLHVGNQARSRIARLNQDGTLDGSFQPTLDGYSWLYARVALQRDGKILIGGAFTSSGSSINPLHRLNHDGSLDSTFSPSVNGSVLVFEVQADGKILVGGRFTTLAGQPRSRIGRLNPDGSLDELFNAGADNDVRTLIQQRDGKLLVGGWFGTLV